jgi:serine/threonine-protein kinase
VGPFTLDRLLGRGGMGEVWLAARDEGGFRQEVALKLLKRGMDSDDLLRRFVQERRILAGLSHPSIARFIDGGVGDDGAPWYAMEYVDGVPVTEHARTKALDVRARVALVAEVAEAVAYAQNRLVVHRDLKPSNILVDAQGRAHLLDFGIAKLLDEAPEASATATGVRAMSPAYAAPEQILDQPISAATDVYSLGVVLYELLTGGLPHARMGATLETLAEQVRHESPERPSARLRHADGAATTTLGASLDTAQRFARAVAGELDTIALTALRREPDRRYASAAAFADDLRRWLDGRPVAAQADTATYRLRKFVARHRLAVGSASAVLLALIAGFGTALWQANVAREQARRAEAEAARAEREAAKSDRVAEFMASLLGAADPMARETTEAPTVGQVVARAAERVERDLGDSPEAQAAVLAELSALAFNGEDVATGKAYAERAQALLDALPAPDPVVSASVARVAGEALLRGGDPTAAATVFRDGLARIAGELDQPQPRRTARIAAAQLENGLGVALYMLAQGVDSAAAFERSIALQAQLYGDDSPQVGVQAANLATVQWSAGQPKDAALSSARAVAIHRKHLGPDDPRLAIVLNMQASIYDDLGRGDEAMAIAREALAIAERAHGAESPRITDMLQNLGELHLMRGEFDAAQVPLARAIASARRSADPRERFLAARSLGQLAMYRDRPGEAIPWLEEAHEAAIKRTSGQGAVPLTIRGMLAWARGLAGAHDAALAELEQVRIALAALPQPDPTDELVRRYYTGEVALDAGRLPLAIENLREALRLADANPPYATSTFAHQSRIALGIALWPDPAGRDEARSLVEAGIAGLEGKSMGFHPLVARGRAVLGAPP